MDREGVSRSPLADLFRHELKVTAPEAERLAAEARAFVARDPGSADDTEEDVLFRLQDPRVFGAFADGRLADETLALSTRISLASRAFDLLTLPGTETDAFAVETRAPTRLLALAAFLIVGDAFTVLHGLHLAYSVFLDRGLIQGVNRATRRAVLHHLLGDSGTSVGLHAFYAGLHLAAVPESEAYEEFESVLSAPEVPAAAKGLIVEAATARDGGVEALRRLAQQEGLLSPDLEDPEAPEVVANIPRLPRALAPAARAWLGRSA